MHGLLGLGSVENWKVEIVQLQTKDDSLEVWGLILEHPSCAVQVRLSSPSIASELLAFLNGGSAEREDFVIGGFLGGQLLIGRFDARLRLKILGDCAKNNFVDLCEVFFDTDERVCF